VTDETTKLLRELVEAFPTALAGDRNRFMAAMGAARAYLSRAQHIRALADELPTCVRMADLGDREPLENWLVEFYRCIEDAKYCAHCGIRVPSGHEWYHERACEYRHNSAASSSAGDST
jgi:hypothetical protein